MQRIRDWQNDYYDGDTETGEPGNMFAPCPLRDHHQVIREIIDDVGAVPTNPSAVAALEDDEYYRGMVEYGRRIDQLTREKWETEYLGEPASETVGVTRRQP